MASFPSVPISNVFNTLDYNEIIEGSLSLTEADSRYFKLIGGTVSGLTTFLAGANVIGTLSINGAPIDLSSITGVTPGIASASKALIVDGSRDLINVNKIQLKQILTKTTNLTLNPTSFSDAYDICISNQSTSAGTNTGIAFLITTLSSDLAIPGASIVASRITQASCDLKFYTSQALRMMISSDGAITGISSLTATNLTGTLQTPSQPNITSTGSLLITPATRTLSGSVVSTNCIWASGSDRYYGMRQPDSNSFVLLAYSAGGVYTDTITYTHLDATLSIAGKLSLNQVGSINSSSNYSGKSNSASLLIRQPNNTNGNGCSIDFMVDSALPGPSISAGASITHIRDGSGSIGSLIFSTKRSAGANTLIVEALRIKSSGSCTIANTTGTDYQLDLGGTGTGINTGSLKFNGTTFNHAYFTDITTGSGDALKALVPNSDKDISGLRDLTISGAFISGSVDTAAYSLSGSSMLASALTGNAAGTAIAGKALVIDSSRNIRFPNGSTTTGQFRFYGDGAGKEELIVFRASDNEGLTIGTKANSVQKCNPLLSLYSGIDISGAGGGTSSAGYSEVIRSNHKLIGMADNYQSGWFHGYLGATPPWKASGFQYCTQFYTSMEALNITCGTSSTSGITTANNILMQNNGKIYFNTTNRSIQANTTFLFNGSSVVRSLGDWLEGGSQVVQEWRNSNNSTLMRVYIPNGGIGELGMSSNDGLGLMTNNTRRLTITSAGRVGIGIDNPSCPFEVSGTNADVTIISSGTSIYSYDLSSNTWLSRGVGPFVLGNVSAAFQGNLHIRAGIWATSDKRVKENIKDIDLPFERFKALKPVSYNYLNDKKKSRVGFIAQNVLRVCSESITMTNNENLKDDGEGSPEGIQLSVDYNSLIALNTNIIQKLIERVEHLEAKLLEKKLLK